MKRYVIIVEKDSKNYAAYVPDLPGCVATGKSIDETKRLLQEAVSLHLAGLREDRIPSSEPSMLAEYLELVVAV